ncbi:hypothetical protein OIU79_027727 [Salix purpurea]|uniref:Uncharacterized protein n=1 Tax=Salix purpurea TaxID=77065 RepID=A0A9Q0VUX4_SALPP|nr:hypothetical protein OIU79_027727 [Salix purpurea]
MGIVIERVRFLEGISGKYRKVMEIVYDSVVAVAVEIFFLVVDILVVVVVVVVAEILMVVVALTTEFLEVGAVVFVDEDIVVVEMVIFYNYLVCLGLLDHEMTLEVSHYRNWQPH